MVQSTLPGNHTSGRCQLLGHTSQGRERALELRQQEGELADRERRASAARHQRDLAQEAARLQGVADQQQVSAEFWSLEMTSQLLRWSMPFMYSIRSVGEAAGLQPSSVGCSHSPVNFMVKLHLLSSHWVVMTEHLLPWYPRLLALVLHARRTAGAAS